LVKGEGGGEAIVGALVEGGDPETQFVLSEHDPVRVVGQFAMKSIIEVVLDRVTR
jgi:hypothetical protein